MSVADRLVGLFSNDDERISTLGHQCRRAADALERQLDRLNATPVTVGMFLRGEITHGLTLAPLRELLKEAEALAARHPDTLFLMSGDEVHYAGEVEGLRGLVDSAAATYERGPRK